MTTQNNICLPHRDIRNETITRIPLHLVHPWKGAIEQAVVSSHHERGAIPVTGTNLGVFGCLERISDGNSYFFVTAHPAGDEGKVRFGTVLYSGTVSARLATAPLAWRWLMQSYGDAFFCIPHFQTYSAPGLMPHEMPLFCGFATPATHHLTAEQNNSVIVIARLAALFLLKKCEAGARESEGRGTFPEPNPAHYPELLTWEA